MGTTANGLPYPEPTDPIAAGAAAIQALAVAVDIWSFKVAFTNVTTTVQTRDVTLPVGLYSEPPHAVITASAVASDASVLVVSKDLVRVYMRAQTATIASSDVFGMVCGA